MITFFAGTDLSLKDGASFWHELIAKMTQTNPKLEDKKSISSVD